MAKPPQVHFRHHCLIVSYETKIPRFASSSPTSQKLRQNRWYREPLHSRRASPRRLARSDPSPPRNAKRAARRTRSGVGARLPV